MLSAAGPITNSSCVAANATSVDNLATAGNTLTQLHNFFEYHTFDTSGPYSDLFSVLLSCCKQLVDINMQHNVVLSSQKKDVSDVSSEIGVLRDVTSRCQEEFSELKPPSLGRLPAEQNKGNRLISSDALKCDVDSFTEQLEKAHKKLQETKAEVLDLRCRQEKIELQQLEGHSQQKEAIEQMQRLAGEMDKLRHSITTHVEYINEEVEAVKSATNVFTSPAFAEREDAVRQQVENKIELLKNELCTAVWGAFGVTDADEKTTPINQASAVGVPFPATGAERRPVNCGDLTAGLRRFGLMATKSLEEDVEELKSRVEVLEVYAPHHRAVAARPPLLGLELSDEKGVGVRVDRVFRGHAAESAGVMPGDVLLAVNSHEVLTRAEMYAVMTEIVNEHRCKCSLITEMHFRQHAGRNSKHKTGNVVSNNNNNIMAAECDGVNWRDNCHSYEMSKDFRESFGPDNCWELPRLEFKLHLKRDGRLLEVSFNIESTNELVKK